MPGIDHKNLVANQFGPRALAYLASSVHSSGDDLKELADTVTAQHFDLAIDIGCGGGHATYAIAPHVGEVVAYDLSVEMLAVVANESRRRGNTNVRAEVGRAEQLPFADSTFDLAVTRFSAHHWNDVRQGLVEAKRILKPTGRIIITDVVSPEEPLLDTFLQTIEMLRDTSHVRDYRVSEWIEMLQGAGFSPGGIVQRSLQINFRDWIARMQTPTTYADAIRKLQTDVSSDITRYFSITRDGDFRLDTMSVSATISS